MSLLIWLPLNENLKNQGLSQMAFKIYNGSSSGLGVSNNGKLGSCYQRTSSSNARYRSDSTINLNNDISMTCWLYIDSMTSDSAQGIITNHSHTHNTGVGLTLKYITNTDARLSCNTGTGSNRTYNAYYGSTNLMGAWHHIGLTYNKATKVLRLWVDGNIDYTLNNYVNASRDDYIDLFGWSTSYVTSDYIPNIRLNDVRIYNHCLSTREMKELAKGLFLHYQFKQKTPRTNLIKFATYAVYNNYGVSATLTQLAETYQNCPIYRLTMTPSSSNISSFQNELYSHGICGFGKEFLANTKYCFWIYYRPVTHNDIRVGGVASNIGGWTEIAPHYYQDGWYRVGQFRNGSVTTNKSDQIFTSFRCPSLKSNEAISIDFCCPHLISGYDSIVEEDCYSEDSASTLEDDVSGYGRNGTIVNTITYDKDSPRYRGCYIPNSGQIICPAFSSSGLSNTYTFSWWSKNSDMNGKMAWGFADGNRLNLYPAGSYFCWNTGDGATNYFKTPGGAGIGFSSYNNQWHHYAVTGNGTTATLYIDGQVIGTALNYRPVTGTQLVISGWTQDGSYKWTNGSLSDFRIYATCLNAQNIKDLYNAPIMIDDNNNVCAMEFVGS